MRSFNQSLIWSLFSIKGITKRKTIFPSTISIAKQKSAWYIWMVLTRRQAKILINQFNNLSINQQVHMVVPVNYVLSPFKSNINLGYPRGIKLYLQAKNAIDKESDTLDILVSNSKDIIDNFLSISNKYVSLLLVSMVDNGEGAKNIFRKV